MRVTASILDGFMHDDKPPQTHRIDFLVRKHHTNEASHFGVRLDQRAVSSGGPDVTGQTITVCPQTAWQHDDFRRHTARRNKVRRQQQLLGTVTKIVPSRFQPTNPLRTSHPVRSNRKSDGAVSCGMVNLFGFRLLFTRGRRCKLRHIHGVFLCKELSRQRKIRFFNWLNYRTFCVKK